MNPANLLFCGADGPLNAARAELSDLDARHAHGEHFWRWTGLIADERRVLGCMFCRRTTAEVAVTDVEAS
jgi:hypothetical protein